MIVQPGQFESLQEEPFALLRIHGDGQVQLRFVAELLTSVDRIHRRLQAIDTLFILFRKGYALPNAKSKGDDRLSLIFEMSERDLKIPRLEAAEFHSPGFWEVLGSLSPLTFISDCLQHWHERKKDDAYRNSAEAAKLWLENEAKANVVLKQRIDILKEAGITNDELRTHVLDPMAASIKTLYTVSETGIIDAHKTQLSLVSPHKFKAD